MKELVLLDSGSMNTVFYNPIYVSKMKDSDNSLSINKNGRLMKSHQKYDIPYINDVWYNTSSITNNISMKDITDKFCITVDPKEELALLVHMPKKMVKLKQFSIGLHAMDLKDKNSFILTKK